METKTYIEGKAEALRLAGIALLGARHEFSLAHEEFLVASGVDPEEAHRLAFDLAR